ncbi:MAG: hypothetical protein ACPGXK_11805 [Phycisphaerae bacterium]
MSKRFFRLPFDDVMSGMGRIVEGSTPGGAMAPMIITMLVTWILYVPVHELLHVYGCIWTGGTVSELQIQWYYFGHQLAAIFDFVVVEGDYAGRLSGFDTKGNDWIYLATDFGPFTLTVLFGVTMLRYCAMHRQRWMFGPSIVLGMAPFYNIQGDYYEMASIILTRGLTILSGGGNPPRFEGLRSDDIFTLFPDIVLHPSAIGLEESALTVVFSLFTAVLGVLLAIFLAFATYWMGNLVATAVLGPAPVFAMPEPKKRRRKKKKKKKRAAPQTEQAGAESTTDDAAT